MTTSMEEIHVELLKIYVGLLGTSHDVQCFDDLIVNTGPKVSPIQADFLVQRFATEDIKAALVDVGNNKSLGLDSYTSYFFKKAWNLVGEDFYAAVLEFFESGQLLKHVNHTIVSLIPKNEHASTVGDFRLISCCNVLCKVITKLLATRLGEILIDKAQSAFIKSRSMVDNIHLAQEIMRGCTRKRTSPKCTLKIDIRKSYYTISWDFLQKVLLTLDFNCIRQLDHGMCLYTILFLEC